MAEVPAQIVHDSFKLLQMEMRAQGLVKQIRDFSGEGTKRFRDWLKDMERVGNAIDADAERYKSLALQTLRGPAADFVARRLEETPNMNWQQLKQLLLGQFSDEGEAHLALLKLRRLKQAKGESVQNFGERIMSLAGEAYVGQNPNNPLIQSALVEVLVEGVSNDTIARRLIRESPDTLGEALTIATREQQAAKSFSMRRRVEEPMDVNELASKDGSDQKRLSHLESNIEVLTNQLGKLLEVQGRAKSENGGQRYKWTEDGRPICSHCNKAGHIRRNCYSLKSKSGRRQGNYGSLAPAGQGN